MRLPQIVFILSLAAVAGMSAASHAQIVPPANSPWALEQQAMQDDGKVDAHLALSRLYRQSGNPIQAVTIMREAQKRQPANEEVLVQLGYGLIESGAFKEAVDIFDQLTAINHQSVAGFNGKAVAFDKAGNHLAAQEIYQTARRLAPDSSTVINNLALSYIMHHEADKAIELLEPWLTRQDAPVAMRHNLALAYGVKGDSARARQINIGLMSEKQAESNQLFYKRYATMLKEEQLMALSPRMQARMDEEEDIPAPVELKPAAGKPAQPLLKEPTAAVAPTALSEPLFEEPKSSFWGYDSKASYPTGNRR